MRGRSLQGGPGLAYRRYAVYFTPPPGSLADFGAAWLGWDLATGRHVTHPPIAGLPAPAEDLTATPRRYGFHATVKPPFRLTGGATPEALAAELAELCRETPPIPLAGLEVRPMGRFLALQPAGDTAALQRVAGRAVRDLDHLRAPLTEAEIARRCAPGLSPRQEAMLRDWGYPYVMDEFRFHITLTGRLDPQAIGRVRRTLTDAFDPLVPRPFVIDTLSLVGEDDAGFFHLVHRYTLSG